MSFKDLVKNRAYELGADLVGFGGIERCAHAPPMMSPQGLLPTARTVIVMAIRHPDACVELSAEKHPQEISPYAIQYAMNARLDEMSYRMATFLERHGHGAIPIVSSNIWRYNQHKDLKAVFAPDVSHIYMAVVAGLADIGYSGLAITPEFGARNRFVTVITDAAIPEDPLIPAGTVCDQCMLCRLHCPAAALSKEIAGDKVLQIGPYEYRFPNKNLWRCSWGEHFGLDLDLDIPDVVTEEVILDFMQRHGRRGGEMGQCLKFCLPRARRQSDASYSKSPVRKTWVSCDESLEPRSAMDRLLAAACARGVDYALVATTEELSVRGVDLDAELPGARSAVALCCVVPDAHSEARRSFVLGAERVVMSAAYDLARAFEDMGFRSIVSVQKSAAADMVLGDAAAGAMLAGVAGLPPRTILAKTVITRKRLAPRGLPPAEPATRPDDSPADMTASLRRLATDLGADPFGVTAVERLDRIVEQLRPVLDGQRVWAARDKGGTFAPWDPEVREETRRLRRPGDLLPGARSVIAFGLRLHREAVRRATLPPAEAVGPFAFQTYITNWLGCQIGFLLVRRIEDMGYRAALSMDLLGDGSWSANPRGPQPDLFSNRLVGVAAGLGCLTESGHLATREFGIRQRIVAVVTDAPLAASPVHAPAQGEMLCRTCEKTCVRACPSAALSDRMAEFECEGVRFAFRLTAADRCDWAKRYALLADSGYGCLGSEVNVKPGREITAAGLADALRQLHPIGKHLPAVAEPCVIRCPYATVGVSAGSD